MQCDARQRLAAAQLDLVRTLVSNQIAPAGFDSSRVRATADALLLKRSHSVARAWPGLARALGSRFDERFAQYARSTPIVQGGGALADGRGFARALAREGPLTDEAALETLAFDLRYRVGAEGAMARRRFSFGAVLLNRSRRFTVAIRMPLLGERRINFPLKILLKHIALRSV